MQYPYQDPALSPRERAEDLLSRMTTLEKVRQLNCQMAMGLTEETIPNAGLGDGMGEMDLMSSSAADMAATITSVQKYMLEKTRLGIPVLFHCEALSGPIVAGAQCFPTSISLGATFAPEIVRDMCERSRKQMTAIGLRQALSPVVDVARDLRWGRVNETYGGDPTLCAQMGTAFVQGLQGENPKTGVAATLKHFLGYSSTSGGLNMARTVADDREIREVYAKPFEAAIRQGKVMSVMNSYSEYNGKPICASKEILTDLLRDDLGFDGLVVSDYMSVNRLVNVFRTAETPTEAGEQCLAAGLDVECPMPYGYNEQMAEDADQGKFDISYINRSVLRVLELKFSLGLFENPYPDMDALQAAMDNSENNKMSKRAAEKAMTLTKNDGILPLSDRKLRLAVIGPMGDAPRAHFAGYTWPSSVELGMGGGGMAGLEETSAEDMFASNPLSCKKLDFHAADEIIRMAYPELRTVKEALSDRFEQVTYVEGCDYSNPNICDFAAATEAAKEADVVIMTLGGRNGWGMFCNSGEGGDSIHIGLPGAQEELLKAVYTANPRMVLVHTDSRPLVCEWAYEHVPAILEGWLCCTYGGVAIAETLTGENNPGGRMQMDVPRVDGHTPVAHYLHRGTALPSFLRGALNRDGYLDVPATPRLPFGFGLSYTNFAYEAPKVTLDGLQVTAGVTVRNTGSCSGDEVVQLYGTDCVASLIRPEQELIGFCRISLEPGQSKRVTFTFGLDQLAFRNDQGEWVVEAGAFRFFFGRNSAEPIYEETVTLDKTQVIDHTKRGFFAQSTVE